jgi:predicted RecA/RadA family phage recombinase
MAQTPVKFIAEGDKIDYTASADAVAGDAISGAIIGVTSEAIDYSESTLAALQIEGIFDFPQAAEIITLGQDVFWDADGSPYGGTATSGAATATAEGNTYLGICLGTTTSTTSYVRVKRVIVPQKEVSPMRVATVAVGGTAQANANAVPTGFTLVTGADDTAAIVLPAAAAGLVCHVKNGVAAKILKVFPAVGDKINAAAANAVYNQTNGAWRTYVAYNAVDWFTDPETVA